MQTYVSWNLLVIGGCESYLILIAPNLLALVLNGWLSVAGLSLSTVKR